jgi:hypothetical protein
MTYDADREESDSGGRPQKEEPIKDDLETEGDDWPERI